MKFIKLSIFAFLLFFQTYAQTELTVKKIMQDPKEWIGTSPHDVFWGDDSKSIYFYWNPDKNPGDSLYRVITQTGAIQKVTFEERQIMPSENYYFNKEKTKKLYTRNGDLYEYDLKTKRALQLTNTLSRISDPFYAVNEDAIYFTENNNLFKLDRKTAFLTQLTDFKKGSEPKEASLNTQDQWLNNDQLAFFEVLKQRKEKKEQKEEYERLTKPKRPKSIYIGDAQVDNIRISPDGKYITYRLTYYPEGEKQTDVPSFVTESGYTENLSTRAKVGGRQFRSALGIFDIANDTSYQMPTEKLPGLDKLPEFTKDYPNKEFKRNRDVIIHGPFYPANGLSNALLEIRSIDNKDRWIALLDLKTGETKILDHQRDEAWIGGPGIDWLYSPGDLGWLPDGKTAWFQSEESGYSHLYTVDSKTGKKKQLTSGKFEVYNPKLSKDEKFWYFHANKTHPGERHFYRMALQGGKMEQLTSMEGRNDVVLSADEKQLAILNSFANRPPELFLKENKPGGTAKKLTQSQTKEWQAYNWRIPEFVTFKADDGAEVHARLYKPANGSKGGPAVIFVHGAGYLQNAHKWWSTYFREYMFHNLLADKGYTVLDIDYRGSAGYGRDWRTAIYRHMGGKDLTDQIDGAEWLVKEHGVAPDKLGIYGGSYGGFITLMAMFTQPDVFKAGAALRSVTDWAHYNHPYTSNILNEPYTDSIAYAKSSPIYYADGLKGHLLIAHGMIDTNVHFQDVVRLAQRLIELEKENWEMAVYPLEDHSFVEPSSWTDEYRRILKLFEDTISKDSNSQ